MRRARRASARRVLSSVVKLSTKLSASALLSMLVLCGAAAPAARAPWVTASNREGRGSPADGDDRIMRVAVLAAR